MIPVFPDATALPSGFACIAIGPVLHGPGVARLLKVGVLCTGR